MITRSESELIARERSNLSARKPVRAPQGSLERRTDPVPFPAAKTEQPRRLTRSD